MKSRNKPVNSNDNDPSEIDLSPYSPPSVRRREESFREIQQLVTQHAANRKEVAESLGLNQSELERTAEKIQKADDNSLSSPDTSLDVVGPAQEIHHGYVPLPGSLANIGGFDEIQGLGGNQEEKPQNPNNFFNNLNNPFWPQDLLILATFGIFLHDAIQYNAKPEARFGASVADLLIGRGFNHNGFDNRSNLNMLLNHFGSDNPTEAAAFWAPLIVTAFTPLCVSAGIVFRNKNTFRNDYITVNNQQLKTVVNVIRFVAYSVTYLRYLALLVAKIKIKKTHDNNAAYCNQQDKMYASIAELADFICLACDHWAELGDYNPAMQTLQGCMDLLFATTRLPDLLLHRINGLQPNLKLKRLDFSQQDLAAWTDEIFDEFFTQLSAKKINLDTLDLSFRNNENITNIKLNAILNYLSSVVINTLNLSNQNWLNKMYKQDFYRQVNLAAIKHVIFQKNNLDDEESQLVGRALNNNYTESINLANNLLSSASGLFNSSPKIRDINLDDNNIEPTSVSTRFANTLRRVSLAGMRFSAKPKLPGLQNIVNTTTLDSLNLASSHLSTAQLIYLFKDNQANLVDELNLSGSDISQIRDQSQFFRNLPVARKLLINDVHLNSMAITALGFYLKKSPTTQLSLKTNKLSVESFVDLLTVLTNTHVHHLIINDMNLSDQHIAELTAYLKRNSQQLTAIDLANNNFSEQSAIPFARQLTNTTVKSLNVSQNKLTNVFCEELSRGFFLSELDISQTHIDGDGLIAMLSVSRSPLTVLTANSLAMTTKQMEEIAKTLISSPYTLDYLTKESLNQDEKRALHQAESATELTQFSLTNSPLTMQMQRVLDRVRMVANPPEILTDAIIPAQQNLLVKTPLFSANQVAIMTQPKSGHGTQLALACALPIGVFMFCFINRYCAHSLRWFASKPKATIIANEEKFSARPSI